ncbi:MAG: UPF0182 family protein [Myxococcales bacterium]|nr:UPF0182 family protein [Myxococcales bacterium]
MFDPPEPQTAPSVRPGTVLVPVALAVVAIMWASGIYVDFRWFASLGYEQVFTKIIWARLLTGALVAVGVGGFFWISTTLALRFSRGQQPLHLYDPDGIPRVNLGQVARRLATPAAIAVGVLSGLFNHRHWETIQFYLHATPFKRKDPIFGKEIAFYVFELPALEAFSGVLFWTVGITAAASAGIYAMCGALSWNEQGTHVADRARAHLHVLAAVLVAIVAYEAYLDFYHLLYSTMGPMTGASYADVHAKLPALRFKVAFAGVAALLILANSRRDSYGLAFLAGALLLTAQIAEAAYPAAVHRFSVVPNEFEKEREYLGHNIEATRAAYGLDSVVERELSGDVQLTAKDVESNRSTIDNVRLWDHRPLLETFAQIQEIRTYYEFSSVHNDRYVIDGELRQTMLSPRELATESLQNRTWVNERFTFTHGYGLTLGPVNEATPEGLPVLLVQDIPPATKTSDIKVTRPSIYFGELSNNYVFVRTANREFHYPAGQSFVETDYDGKDGIRFDSTLMRLALATHLRSFKILLSNDIDSDSRVLLHRNIISRVARVLPFARFTEAPYMIVRDDGTLMWIIDGYLATDRYPYAERIGRNGSINYLRNSIKVTVDAYDGTVTAYANDEQDPLLSTWRKIFPGTFEPLAEMPEDVRAHLRYPEQIFRIQAEMFATYHMDQPQLIYNREDKWQVPSITNNEGSPRVMEPYYTVMKLPGEKAPEFILMLPFTPSRKDNLSAWMVARADGTHYGELVVYRFPKDRLIFGPQQIVNRINQDAEISRQISLWDQRGSEAVFGTLLVIPIERSLIYVRPLYLQSEGGKIPELKRVIVAYEKKIAMEPSLREAVDAVFRHEGGPSQIDSSTEQRPSADVIEPTTEATLEPRMEIPATGQPQATRALRHFERAIAAQRSGDWAGYGRELDRVEALLRAMQPTARPTEPARGAAPQGAARIPEAVQSDAGVRP